MQFDYERLDVYAFALDFVVMADEVTVAASRPHGDLADQLKRASLSIVTNLAEGAGEFSPREKARFYRMARRSATECAALVDVYRRLKLVDEQLTTAGRTTLFRIVQMLVRLIHATENPRNTAHA